MAGNEYYTVVDPLVYFCVFSYEAFPVQVMVLLRTRVSLQCVYIRYDKCGYGLTRCEKKTTRLRNDRQLRRRFMLHTKPGKTRVA